MSTDDLLQQAMVDAFEDVGDEEVESDKEKEEEYVVPSTASFL